MGLKFWLAVFMKVWTVNSLSSLVIMTYGWWRGNNDQICSDEIMLSWPLVRWARTFMVGHLMQSEVTTVSSLCHCLTCFKVKIQLDLYCIGDGSYIDVYLGLILAKAKIPRMSKGEQGVKNKF